MLRWGFSILCAFTVFGAGPVNAADRPPIEIVGGFSSLASGGCCLPATGSVPVGWYAELGIGFTDWFSLVGQLGGDYNTVQAYPFPAVHNRTYSWLAGPR